MNILTLKRVVADLQLHWEDKYSRQVNDPQSHDHGGVIHPHWDRPERGPDMESSLIASALVLAVACSRGICPDIAASKLRASASNASRFLIRNLRPSNRLDLIRRHTDDGTANAFAMQGIGPALLLARELATADPAWSEALEPVEELTRRMTLGMIGAGFHTPNHRWVMCGALAIGGSLHPDIDIVPELKAYLAETVDVDEEGFYLERSIGVYDGFCDRSLLLVHEYFSELASLVHALDAALLNLKSNLWLTNADGSVETGLSHRQDKGSAAAGMVLVEAYTYAAILTRDDTYFSAAQRLFAYSGIERKPSPFLAQLFLRFGEYCMPSPTPRLTGRKHFVKNGIVRLQEERLDATFFKNDHKLCHLKFGHAEVASIKIEQAYFGHGKFLGEKLDVGEDTMVFESDGNKWHPYWPGYDLPAGRPVPRDEFYALGASGNREHREIPRCTSRVTVTRDHETFVFRYQTLNGMARTLVQLSVDFPPGGRWETEDCLLEPIPGQHMHLKKGFGRMWYGSESFEISPGHYTHSCWAGTVPDLAGPGPLVRVLLTFETPVDYIFRIRPLCLNNTL